MADDEVILQGPWPEPPRLRHSRKVRDRIARLGTLASILPADSGLELTRLQDLTLPSYGTELPQTSGHVPDADGAGQDAVPGPDDRDASTRFIAALCSDYANGERTIAIKRLLAFSTKAQDAGVEYSFLSLCLQEIACVWTRTAGDDADLEAGVLSTFGQTLTRMGSLAAGVAFIERARAALLEDAPRNAHELCRLRYLGALCRVRSLWFRSDGLAELKSLARSVDCADVAPDVRLHAALELEAADSGPGRVRRAIRRIEILRNDIETYSFDEPVAAALQTHASFAAGSVLYSARSRNLKSRAIEMLEEVVERSERSRDWWLLAQTLDMLGRLCGQMGRHQAAGTHLGRSIALKLELKDLWGLGSSLNGLGMNCIRRGLPDDAVAFFGANRVILSTLDALQPKLLMQNLGLPATALLSSFQNPFDDDVIDAEKLSRLRSILDEYADILERNPDDLSTSYLEMLRGMSERAQARPRRPDQRQALLEVAEARFRRCLDGFRKANHAVAIPNAEIQLANVLVDRARLSDDPVVRTPLLTEALSRLEDAAGHNWDTYVQTYLDLAFAWYHDALGETWEVERHLASAGIHAAFCGNGAVPIPANAGGGLRLDGPTGEAVCDVILTPGEAMRLDFRAADWKHRPLVRYGLRAVLEVDPDHPAPSLELRNDRCETDDGGTAAFTVACTDIAPTGRIWLRVADEFGLKTALVRILVQPFPIMLPDAPHRSISLTHIEDVLIRHLLGPRCISATIVKQFGGGLSGARVLLVEPRMSVSRSTSREPGFDVKGQLCIIKTGPRGAIMAEGERYERYVHDILGGNASHVASKTAWADHGGLRLNLVDEPDGGAARDEASWLPVNQTSEGRRLLERVFREDFGTNWYRQKADSPTARLLDFQARFMPPLLRLRDLPSGEGLSYDRQPQQVVRSFIEDGLRCPGPSRPFDRGAVLHLGSMRIDGFFHEDDGTGPAWRYRLTRPEDGLRIDFLSPIAPEYMEIDGVADHLMGKPRFVTGEVDRLAFDWLFERQSACISAFNELQQEAELGYEDDGRSLLIRFASGASRKLPNPLWSLHDLAVMNLRCRRSIIHGDMHTRNVIVGRAMHYYIDFEFAGVGPTLYDFIKHEFVLWSWNWASWPEGPRPPECTLANALRLMDALADPSDPFPALHVALSLDGPPSWIHRMFELIAHLRQLALEYVEDRGSKRDYFAPLCLHSTLALRWYDPSKATSDETRLAVAREGLILNLLAAVLLDRGMIPGIAGG